MDRITPEAVVEAVKQLGVKAASVPWTRELADGSYVCCGAGALLSLQDGSVKALNDSFKNRKDGEVYSSCFDKFARRLGLDREYLTGYTQGFDGGSDYGNVGYIDGVESREALIAANLWNPNPGPFIS